MRRWLVNLLKKNSIIYSLNQRLKSAKLKNEWSRLVEHYYALSKKKRISYCEHKAFQQIRRKASGSVLASQARQLRIFWVGANKDQDFSGFIQALLRFGEVKYFINQRNEYGLWYRSESGEIEAFDPSVIAINDERLISQVKAEMAEGKIDLLIGQMWANFLSPEALEKVSSLGIPIVNISMDDKIPANWEYRHGRRMGAVGLAHAVDLTLTTTSECCRWYHAEGCDAVYWPLGSDPDLFFADNSCERDIDVVFIGNKYGVRERIVSFLISNGVNVSAWGGGWDNGYASVGLSSALSRRAKIILGVGAIGHSDNVFTLKLRDFDGPASGGLYITHRNPALTKLFVEGAEIECYESDEECLKKVIYYLENESERIKIANNGQRKVRELYNWDSRISEVFDKIFCSE